MPQTARTASTPAATLDRRGRRATTTSGIAAVEGARDAAVQPQGAAGEPAAHRGRRQRHRRADPGGRPVGPRRRARHRDPVLPRPRGDAGLHRRARRGRPGHHARGRRRARRRPGQDQPAGPGRTGHRPLRDRRPVRHARRLRPQRRARVRAQPRALPVPALGPDRVRRVQGRPAGHRHRPPGQHRVPGPRRLRPQRAGLPRHPGRHRLAHHHGQRPGRARAGASAASRPRRPCSASRSACSSPASSASSSAANCRRARPPPTWC